MPRFFKSLQGDGAPAPLLPAKIAAAQPAVPPSFDPPSFDLPGDGLVGSGALESRVEAYRDLKALSGDPDRLEASDLDASDEFDVGATDEGFVLVTGPNRSRVLDIEFSDDADSFEEIAGILKARAEEAEANLAALKALSGDEQRLEASDLDASEDFSIGESETGAMVINLRERSIETRVPYSEDTDSFVDLVEALPMPRFGADDLDPGDGLF